MWPLDHRLSTIRYFQSLPVHVGVFSSIINIINFLCSCYFFWIGTPWVCQILGTTWCLAPTLSQSFHCIKFTKQYWPLRYLSFLRESDICAFKLWSVQAGCLRFLILRTMLEWIYYRWVVISADSLIRLGFVVFVSGWFFTTPLSYGIFSKLRAKRLSSWALRRSLGIKRFCQLIYFPRFQYSTESDCNKWRRYSTPWYEPRKLKQLYQK